MGWKKSLLFIVATLVLMAGFKAASPTFRHWRNERRVDEVLRTDPFYRIVLADTPALRGPLRTSMVKAYDSGRLPDAFAEGHRLLTPVLPSYIPRGSDATTLDFGRKMLTSLKERAADPEDCYRMLFPEVAGPPTRAMSAADHAAAEALRQLVVSTEGRAAPAPALSSPAALKPVVARLSERHGEKLALLQTPEAPDVDRGAICAMTVDLYDEVLRLPEPEALLVLRYLMGVRP